MVDIGQMSVKLLRLSIERDGLIIIKITPKEGQNVVFTSWIDLSFSK